MIRTDLGIATAYAEAVSKGYTGTRDEFGQMFADFGKTAEKVTEDKKAVEQMKLSVEETKNSVNTTAAGFGQNVADKTAEAKSAITEHANTEKASATAAISEAKDAATGAITEAQTSATDAIASAKDSATAEITKKGTDTLATIPEDYTALTRQVGSLKEDLSNKITKFYASNQGETHITDSDNGKIQDMMIYGKSSQDGTPSPENPVEIKSVVNPTIKLIGSNILKMMDGEYQENGLTTTVSNGVVKLKGTATTYQDIALTQNLEMFFKEGTEIIFSPNKVKGIKGLNNGYLDFSNNNTMGFSIQSNNINTPYIIKKGDSEYGFVLFIRCVAGVAYDEIWKPQILIGKTITAFKPYTEQTITLPITLNAIPVSSGGNVTIDGQQYVSDRIVEKDGVFGIERNIRKIHTNTKTMNNIEEYPGWDKVEGVSDAIYYATQLTGDSRKVTYISNFTQIPFLQNNKKTNNSLYCLKSKIGYSQSELIAKAIDVDMYIRLQDAIFEPLPGDIQAKLRTLVTNYPVTNISITSDQLDGYTVFNYPISMKNGWDYVKKQLNDNRDYIYDMDTQSAEAYVNSEYAVALTELEV